MIFSKRVSVVFLSVTSLLFASDIETISKINGVLSSGQLSGFKQLFGLHSFIETGTYAGETTAEAAKVFEEVHTIEIFEPLYKSALVRFSEQPNVALYLGDTTRVLAQVIKQSYGKRLYWLDAHSSGEGTGGIPGFSPILLELNQILTKANDLDSVILINDLRGMCHCDDRTNLPLIKIIQKIKKASTGLQLYSIGDIGIIFDEERYPSIPVSELVKNASISRFFDSGCEDEQLLVELIDAESFIASSTSVTPENITFSKLEEWVNRNCLGGEVIYLLWHALQNMEKKDFTSAIRDLRLVTNSFYSHWRIDVYLVKALILDGQIEKGIALFNDELSHIYNQYPRLIEKIMTSDLLPLLKRSGI